MHSEDGIGKYGLRDKALRGSIGFKFCKIRFVAMAIIFFFLLIAVMYSG